MERYHPERFVFPKFRFPLAQKVLSWLSEHAVIKQTESGDFELSDLSSKNGTFINDEAVSEPTALKEGDVIRFGLAACEVVSAAGEADSSASIHPPVAPPARMVIKGSRKSYYASSKGIAAKRTNSKTSEKKD